MTDAVTCTRLAYSLGDTRAVDGLDLTVQEGEVFGRDVAPVEILDSAFFSSSLMTVAGIVLRDMRGLRGHGRRWAMEHHRGHGPRGGAPDGERPMPR